MWGFFFGIGAFLVVFVAVWIAIKWMTNNPPGLSEQQRRRLLISGSVIALGIILDVYGWYQSDPSGRSMSPLDIYLPMAAIVVIGVGVRMVTRWSVPLRAPWLRKRDKPG